MESIGVRELRQNASAYLRRVRSGETIVITDRGTPIARIVPIGPSGWQRLVDEGRLRPAVGDLRDLGEPVWLPRDVEAPSRRLDRMRDE
jgi:prevent-host-death family protein